MGRRKNRMNTEMEVAPLRTLDDFILTKSRFQIPNFQDEDRWFNRIIYNLMYYQTNYLISSALIFGFVLFARPQEMIMGIFLMALGLVAFICCNQDNWRFEISRR